MSKKKFDRGSYGAKKGSHGKGHPFGGGQREMSIGAIRQRLGKPYFPEPPRGFRPGDR